MMVNREMFQRLQASDPIWYVLWYIIIIIKKTVEIQISQRHRVKSFKYNNSKFAKQLKVTK